MLNYGLDMDMLEVYKMTLLTIRETAKLIKMHEMSVYKMIKAGKLPALKIGGRFRVVEEDIYKMRYERR